VGPQATIPAVFLDYDLAGISPFSSPHAYTPHVTFGYGLPSNASLPAPDEPARLEVEGVTLAFGEQSTTWRFLRRDYYSAELLMTPSPTNSPCALPLQAVNRAERFQQVFKQIVL
jgi:hypothetical protein